MAAHGDLHVLGVGQIEAEASLFAVDLGADAVLVAAGRAGYAERGRRAVLHPGEEIAHVVGCDRHDFLAVQLLALLDDDVHLCDQPVVIAGEEAHRVEDVYGQIAAHAVARDFLVKAPVQSAALPVGAVLEIAGVNAVDAADLALVDQLFGIAHGGEEAIGKADL